MPRRRTRVAVVGVDRTSEGWGARGHVPAILALPELELAAVCTAHRETSELAARKLGVPLHFWDHEALAKSREIDLVTIAVRVRSHFPIARAALQAGKMVFCEWPLAMNSREALELAKLAQENRISHAVGNQARFLPGFAYLKKLIDSEYIGQPLFFNLTHFLPKFKVRSDHVWPTIQGEVNDVLSVAASHCLDIVRWCLGEPKSVLGTLATKIPHGTFADSGESFEWSAYDTTSILIRLDNAISGVIHASYAATGGSGFKMEVFGTEGKLVVSGPKFISYSPNEVLSSRRGENERKLVVPPEYVYVSNLDSTNPAFSVAQILDRFMKCAKENKEFHPDFGDGHRLHRIIEAISLSASSSHWQEISS